jgi:hypothetical protein
LLFVLGCKLSSFGELAFCFWPGPSSGVPVLVFVSFGLMLGFPLAFVSLCLKLWLSFVSGLSLLPVFLVSRLSRISFIPTNYFALLDGGGFRSLGSDDCVLVLGFLLIGRYL